MKKHYPISVTVCLLILVNILLTNCQKDNSTQGSVQNVTGYVQKGPFINGSSVTVYDLQSNLSASGKSFNTQIIDNKGTFELNDISLSSNYIGLRADGFYFNEVSGEQSNAQITLNALADISGKSEINVNVLTHLEKPRVEYLMKGGMTFADAKNQAQKEILNIFEITKSDVKASENLNIAENGDDNGILLAVSAILQGYRSESEMTELLSNISNDIRDDGVLSSQPLGSALINHAVMINPVSVKSNLSKRYGDIGVSANIPDFGKYVSNFISETKFVMTQSLITYPETGINGDNILSLSRTAYGTRPNTSLSLAAQLAKGTALKIKITSLSADTTTVSHTGTSQGTNTERKATWFYALGSNVNWTISDFDLTNYSQTFTANESDKACNLGISFDKGSFLIEYYEMNSATPNRTKTITCN